MQNLIINEIRDRISCDNDIPDTVEIDLAEIEVYDECGNVVANPDTVDLIRNGCGCVKSEINCGEYDQEYIIFDAEIERIINGIADYSINVTQMSSRLMEVTS